MTDEVRRLLVFLLFSYFVLYGFFGLPIAKAADEESAALAAEQAGNLREALKHYLAALQSTSEDSPADQRLREKIIGLVQKLDPPPAIPEEAWRYSVWGNTANKEAKTRTDFKRAAEQFEKALRLAPWWADLYLYAGIAHEYSKNFDAAIRNFKLYLIASPNATDAGKVRTKLYELEYRSMEVRTRPPDCLEGTWISEQRNRKDEYRFTIDGDRFRLTGSSSHWCVGVVEGDKLRSVDCSEIFSNGKWELEGQVSEGCREVRLKYTVVIIRATPGGGPIGSRITNIAPTILRRP